MKITIVDILSCGVNYQTDYILEYLYPHFEITKDLKEADIVLMLGGCCCTEDSLNYSLKLIDYILDNKISTATTYLCGCITRTFKDIPKLKEIEEYLKNNIDHIIDFYKPQELLQSINENLFKDVSNNYGVYYLDDTFADIFIQNGCTHNCSFCKCNYLNCKLIDAPIEKVKRIIDELDADNIKSIQLRGLNLSQYGLDLYHDYKLMEICEYIEGKHNIEELILSNFAFSDAIKNGFDERLKYLEKVKTLTGSLESGSNRILKLMNKGFTKEQFLAFYDKINELYNKRYSLNIISGFPTETVDDCLETLEVLKYVNPSYVNINTYLDSQFVPSHNLEQLPYRDIRQHTKIYKRVLKRNSINCEVNGNIY